MGSTASGSKEGRGSREGYTGGIIVWAGGATLGRHPEKRVERETHTDFWDGFAGGDDGGESNGGRAAE